MANDLVINNLLGAVVGPFDLTVPEGTCAAISGPSGAGKSLFLRMIADLDPNDGDVRLGELRRVAVAPPVWRRQVAHVAAQPGWWADRVDAHFSSECLPAAKAMAEHLGIPGGWFERPVRSLSTGEGQRLALVRTLSRCPKCLLLDEPTSALDAASTGRVEALLRDELARGTILILVSHDPHQGQRLGSQTYEMASGRLSRT